MTEKNTKGETGSDESDHVAEAAHAALIAGESDD